VRFVSRVTALSALLEGVKARLMGQTRGVPSLLEHVPLILWTTDAELRITSAFGAGLTAAGRPGRSAMGGHLADLLGGEEPAAPTIKAHRRAFAGEAATCEQPWEGRVLHVTVEPLRNADRAAIHGAIGLALDITDRKRAEGELARLAAIVESSDDAIIAQRLDGIITAWNGGAERLYGFAAAEAVGRSIAIIIPPERPSELPAILARIARGDRLDHYEAVRVRKDGTRVEVCLSVTPIRDRAGRILGASSIARDVSDRKRAERAEQQVQPLRAVANLAVAAAHEINNPLAVVAGQLHLLTRRTEDPASRHRIAIALEAADRVRDVVARLGRFTRARVPDAPSRPPAAANSQRSSEDPEHPRVA
jgi:PAS domain S-box-containing protein